MPYRKDAFSIDGYYHVFNRGASKQNIFVSPDNFVYFSQLLQRHASKNQIGLICYCLMPNHYHMLVCQESEISLPRFVQGLCSAYTQALNKQRGRTGTLFEGRYKYVLVDKKGYLLHLIRYVHLNPVAAELVAHPEEWQFSDYNLWVTDFQPPTSRKFETFGKLVG